MPAPVPTASVAGAIRDRREVIHTMAAMYSAMTTRIKASAPHGALPVRPATSRYTRRSAAPRGGVVWNCSTVTEAGIRARNAAQVPKRRTLAARLSPTGPRNGRASSGSPASTASSDHMDLVGRGSNAG